MKTFEEYSKEYLTLDADGLVACRHEGLHGEKVKTPEYSDFKQVWDFCSEKAEKKMMLVHELDELLHNPFTGLMEEIYDKGDDPVYIQLGNDLNRIKKIIIALKG